MFACAGGHEEVVKALLEANANVEDHNENGHTPLMEAASAGHVNVAEVNRGGNHYLKKKIRYPALDLTFFVDP